MIELFKKYSDEACTLLLLNNTGAIVGSVVPAAIKLDEVILTQLKASPEKYLLSYQGLTIFFSSYKKT